MFPLCIYVDILYRNIEMDLNIFTDLDLSKKLIYTNFAPVLGNQRVKFFLSGLFLLFSGSEYIVYKLYSYL
jgi:hypothetical protein